MLSTKYIYIALILFVTLMQKGLAQDLPYQDGNGTENALFETAVHSFESGTYFHALEVLQRIYSFTKSDREKEYALYYAGECLYHLKRYDEAAEIYIQVLRNYPYSKNRIPMLMRLGEICFLKQQWNESIRFYKQLLDNFATENDCAIASFRIGKAYEYLQQNESARKYFLLSLDYSPSSSIAAETYYALAESYRINREYNAALFQYDKLHKYFPTHSIAMFALLRIVEIYIIQKENTKAISILDSLDNIDRLYSSVRLYQRICIEFDNNDVLHAQKHCAQFLTAFPIDEKRAEVQFILAQIYIQTKKNLDAIEILKNFSAPDSSLFHEISYYYAIALLRNGNKDEAHKRFESIAIDSLSPYQYHAQFELALFRLKEKKYDVVARLLAHIVNRLSSQTQTSSPQKYLLGESHRLLGELFYHEKKYSDATINFKNAFENELLNDSLRGNALFGEAKSLYQLAQYQESAKLFEETAKKYLPYLVPDEVFYWTAESHYHNGDYSRAKLFYSQIFQNYKLSAFSAAALIGYGWSALALEEYDSSEIAFEKVLLNFPQTPYAFQAYLRIGDVYYHLKKYGNAIAAYRKAIEKYPNESQKDYAYFQLAQTLFRTKQHIEALEQLRLLMRNFPSSELRDETQFSIAKMYFQEGNFNHAIVEYEIFVARYWKNSLVPVAIVETGDAYYNLQKYDKAIEMYRKVLHDYPLNNAVHNAIKGIEYAYDIQEQNNKAKKIIEEFYIAHPEMKKQTNEKND